MEDVTRFEVRNGEAGEVVGLDVSEGLVESVAGEVGEDYVGGIGGGVGVGADEAWVAAAMIDSHVCHGGVVREVTGRQEDCACLGDKSSLVGCKKMVG